MNYCFCLCVQKNDHDEDLDGEEGPLPGLGANKQELPMWWLFPLLCLLLQLWLLFQQQSVNNNGGSCPTLVFFFLLFIVGSPLRVPSFGDVGDGHNGFLLMCFTNGGTNDEKEKGEKKKKERGREPSMVVVMVEPISLLFLLICVSFSHFGYRCLIRVQIHKN